MAGLPLNAYGQWTGDYTGLPPDAVAAIQAALAQANSMTPGASTVDPRTLDPMTVLAGAYDRNLGNNQSPAFYNIAQQLGVDPNQAIAQLTQNVDQYNTGGLNDLAVKFGKDAAGIAGLAAGGLALGGQLLAPTAAGVTSDAATFAGLPSTAVGASQTFAPATGAIPDVTLPAGVGYVGGASAADTLLPGISAAVNAGAPVSSLLTQFPEYGSLFGSAAGALPAGTSIGPNGLPDATNAPVNTGNPVGGPGGTSYMPSTSSLPSWLQNLGSYAPLIGAGTGLLDSLLQPNHTTTTQGGTSQSTNTSSLQLPSQLTGAAGTALDRANQLLTQGQQFAPLPYVINHAADQLNNLGTNNAPTTSSFASGANINPYLDQTFNAAADATQNRTASEFANAGQFGSPQNIEARRQQLEQLAAGIYGPGYQNAQNLQYGAQEAGVQRGLTQQDSNLNRTLQASQVALPLGQYMQQQQQQQLNAPYTNLGQYINQVGALSPYFPGTTTQSQGTTQTGQVTQPLYNNPVSSVLGGTVLGSYYGNLLNQQPQQQGNAYGMQTPQNMNVGQGFGAMPAYSYL